MKAGVSAPSASQNGGKSTSASLEPATPTRARIRKPAVAQATAAEVNADAGPSRAKRPADVLSTPSRGQSTPKRAKAAEPLGTPSRTPSRSNRAGYSVVDPNPFSASPKKPNGLFPSLSKQSADAASPFIAHDSPFIHANTPRKLREVLEANSLRKSRERAEITPRTKARKRLAGEHVDDTPFKVRKRRGEHTASSSSVHAASDPASAHDEEEVDDDDEGLGETPVAPGAASFSLGLSATRNGVADDHPVVEQPSRTNLYALFQKAKQDKPAAEAAAAAGKKGKGPAKAKAAAKPKANGSASASAGRAARAAAILGAPTTSLDDDDEMAGEPSTPPAAPAKSPARTPRRAHELTLSDDEVDEWDPEGETRKLAVRVTGTRRRAVRVAPRAGIASDDEGEAPEEDVGEEQEEEEEALDDEQPEAEPAPQDMLSLLSLRSPAGRKGERLADLRVRALLDPTSAAAVLLRAQQKGQDVFGAGEDVGVGGGWRGEGSEVEVEEEEVEGDDDWESDPEGWKADVVEEEW